MVSPIYFSESHRSVSSKIVKANHIILVEGSDELWFFEAILSDMSISPNIVQTMEYGGKDRLSSSLSLFVKTDSVLDGYVRGVLVTGDLDLKPIKRLYDVAKIMGDCGLGKPGNHEVLDAPGAISRSGLFLFPDKSGQGSLDTALLKTVSESTAVTDARSYVEKHHRDSSPLNDKRVTQAYLATRPALSRGAGRGAKNGYFNLKDNTLQPLRVCIQSILA